MFPEALGVAADITMGIVRIIRVKAANIEHGARPAWKWCIAE